jgi:hypothetical protein
MEQVGGARAGAPEQLDPGSDEPVVGGIVDGGKDAIGRIRAILVGGLEGNGRGQWLRTLERGRVVERVDVDPGEEAPRVGRLVRLSERARGERRLPACGRQCARERAGDLRRPAARKEEERRDDESVRCRRAAGALRDGASSPNRLLPAWLDSRPSAARGDANAASAAPGPPKRNGAESPSKPGERSPRGDRTDPHRERTFAMPEGTCRPLAEVPHVPRSRWPTPATAPRARE